MNYRQFSLKDGSGQVLSLTSKTIFASNPQGFGFNHDISVLRLGNEQSITYEQIKMPSITLDVKINGVNNISTYSLYNQLVAFLTRSPLYLIYDVPSATSASKRIKVKAVSLTKTETNEDGVMSCALSLTALSLWEDAEETTVDIYPTTTSGTDIENVVSMVNTPILLEYVGGSDSGVNPTLSFQQNGTEYGYIDFVGTYDVITINADELNESLVLSNDGTAVANPYAKQDFTTYATKSNVYKTFVCLKAGTTKVIPSGFSGGTMTIKYRNRYLSV